jgi:Na+/melibiose symporter-like transporter
LAQSRWVAWREGFALVGVLLASALPALWGWAWTTALLVLMLALGLYTWHRTAQTAAQTAAQTVAQRTAQQTAHTTPGLDVNVHARADSAGARPAAPHRNSVWQPWTHAGFRRLLAVFMLNGLASAVPATLVLFFVQDRLQAPRAMEPLFLGLYFAAGALSFPLWLRVIERVGLRRTWALGMALSVLAFGGVIGLGVGDTTAFLVVCAVSGMALGADLTVPGALLNQLIDRCGERGRSDGAFMESGHQVEFGAGGGFVAATFGAVGLCPGAARRGCRAGAGAGLWLVALRAQAVGRAGFVPGLDASVPSARRR